MRWYCRYQLSYRDVEEVLRRMKGSRIRNYNANIRVAAERGRDDGPRVRPAKKTGKTKAKAGDGKPRTRSRGR